MNPKEVVAKNLQYYLDRKGITQTQMAHDLGYPEMTVSNWMKAKTYPRVDKLQEMADYFNIKRSNIEEEKEYNIVLTSSQYHYMPTTISAGLPINVDGITKADKISIPDAVMGKWAGHNDIIFTRISGDSMNNKMSDGSLIAIKNIDNVESLKDGDIVVFSHNHEYSVKHFYKTDDKLIFKPDSTNKAHHEQQFAIDDGVEIHGKVVLYIVELD